MTLDRDENEIEASRAPLMDHLIELRGRLLICVVAFIIAFLVWIAATGDLHRAITIAVAVLIVTCPCALALAVPMVQIVAARRLFEHGIMVKDGAAMERLAEIDGVVFDKTGTLTYGTPRLIDADAAAPRHLALAATLASHSRHPYSRALAAAGNGLAASGTGVTDISEQPGSGLQARIGTSLLRLGRPEWALAPGTVLPAQAMTDSCVVLTRDGVALATFGFEDRLRPGIRETLIALEAEGLSAEMLSGDREPPVRRLAETLGLAHVASVSPRGKMVHIEAAARSGRKLLMVGDGLNDAPALARAHASMAPASAADVGRNAADFVFLRDNLLAVPQAISIARAAQRLVRQNLFLAVAYNVIAVPIAVLGHVTPLVAAITMSASSLVVIGNALRLGRQPDAAAAQGPAPAPLPLPMVNAR